MCAEIECSTPSKVKLLNHIPRVNHGSKCFEVLENEVVSFKFIAAALLVHCSWHIGAFQQPYWCIAGALLAHCSYFVRTADAIGNCCCLNGVLQLPY